MRQLCTQLHVSDSDCFCLTGLAANLSFLLLLFLQTHSCLKAGERCLKTDPETGEKYCRNYLCPDSFGYNYIPAKHTYTMEDAEVLQDAGMAEVNGTEFEVDEKLIGGRHVYPARKKDCRLPTNPLLFMVMRSCTNVQVRVAAPLCMRSC